MSSALVALVLCVALAPAALAQQRPLVTEDPETIGGGRVLLEAGFDWAQESYFEVSGLEGNLFAVPTIGVSVGLGSIAEVQVDGGFYRRLSITDRSNAPFASILDIEGDETSAMDDLLIATKIRLAPEGTSRPSLGLRVATRLALASNESGLGRDTTDFFASLLVAKTVQSIRIVGNAGVAVQGDPTQAARQDELFTYGFSVARAVTDAAEFVGEINGRFNNAAFKTPGASNRAVMRLGGRYTRGPVRADAGVLLGMTPRDPQFGLTAGVTWVFDAFQVP